ncbi:hypothetical protein AWZ03_007898 [Drosophila navojoa]|uniref:RPA-interacting protein C-terminal domain-containing protein n=1 Tax=Drosophila navojoa TaxID=7232 RepID=A0A484BA14_DRONA|nr:RIP-like protein [Drosophila navojoa]TDG45623.1 hypothetical protein AWZ03_007898 [Drosophila navojoa]
MQCPSSPINHTSVEQKRHAQNVARQQRIGMPKLREMLREKCRIRILNARNDRVDGNRKVQLSELEEILRLELKELDQDLELEQHVYEELLSDVNEWYALQEQHLEALYTEPDTDPKVHELICPVCLIKSLQRFKSLYTCECGARFEHAADKPQLEQLIKQKVNEHELNCTQALQFFIEAQPTGNRLFTICGSCDFCSSI